MVRAPTSLRPAPSPRAAGSGVARASGILGISALGLLLLTPIIFLVADLLDAGLLLLIGIFGAAGLSFLTSLISIGLAIHARLRGAWAIVGLVTGIVSALFSLIGSLGLLFLL